MGTKELNTKFLTHIMRRCLEKDMGMKLLFKQKLSFLYRLDIGIL